MQRKELVHKHAHTCAKEDVTQDLNRCIASLAAQLDHARPALPEGAAGAMGAVSMQVTDWVSQKVPMAVQAKARKVRMSSMTNPVRKPP